MPNTTVTATRESSQIRGKHYWGCALALACSIALYWKPLVALVHACLENESYSHILLIPFIALYLLWSEKSRVLRGAKASAGLGLTVICAGLLGTIAANPHFYSRGSERLSACILCLVVIWWGVFLAFFGFRASRNAWFALLFLLLAVPFPDDILSRTIAGLQHGSVEISFLLFKLLGVPVLRRGVLLSVPGVTIEVARECSSIRSSMALFITCLLAARFFLRSFWKQAIFVALSLPLSIIKNGIRITTLTLLSIWVNPGFLHGSLHRDGGFVFFLLALAMLWPVLIALQRSEARGNSDLHAAASRRELFREQTQ